MPSLEPPLRPTPPRPTASDVRRAADALKDAIDAHLFAVETRLGESDPAVQRTFRDIARSAETYDDLLYQAYDEVTPFEFGDGEGGDLEDVESPHGNSILDAPPVISVLMRRDYAVVDPPLLLETGRNAYSALREVESADLSDGPPENLPASLYTMFQLAGVDGFDNGSEEAGLVALGGAVWFLARPRAELVDVDSPFEDLDPDELIFRIQEVPDTDQ